MAGQAPISYSFDRYRLYISIVPANAADGRRADGSAVIIENGLAEKEPAAPGGCRPGEGMDAGTFQSAGRCRDPGDRTDLRAAGLPAAGNRGGLLVRPQD